MERNCRHPDIRTFDEVRCCLACGLALFESPRTESEISSQDYSYRPLNFVLGQEIRLLVLNPGWDQDEITCDIVHSNLLNNPSYEAISYTWADENYDASLSERIYCRGQLIRITKNCAAALRSLRQKALRKTLWVDSVCIDQVNVKERNHQVGIMKIIYAKAANVIVYLGPSASGSDQLFQYLEEAKVHSEHFLNMECEKRLFLRTSLSNLLSRRWFHRLWIIQEVALAKHVVAVAGRKLLNWSALSPQNLRKVGLLEAYHPGQRLGVPNVLAWASDLKHVTDPLVILHTFRQSEAADARDHIYALIGLFDEDARSLVSPDYDKSYLRVFQEFASILVTRKKRLDILRYADEGRARGGGLPSWVPHWHTKKAFGLLPIHLYAPLRPPFLEMAPFEVLANSHLSVRAYRLGFISRQLVDDSDYYMDDATTEFSVYGWTEDLIQVIELIGWRSNRLRFWNMIRVAIEQPQLTPSPMLPIVDYPQIFKIFCCQCRFMKATLSSIHDEVEIARFTEAYNQASGSKRLFLTDTCALGFTTRELKTGDSIWFIDGAKSLIILRKIPGGNNEYSAIGECYLHGAMEVSRACGRCGELICGEAMTMEDIEIV